MKRGEIYYIKNGCGQIGHEMKKDRPAVIVSNDAFNEKAEMVTIVYLTRTPREDLLTHVKIRSTGRTSEAVCEQISSISTSRVNNYLGRVTEDEMKKIETAIQIHLAMTVVGIDLAHGPDFCGGASVDNDAENDRVALVRAQAERDTIRDMYEKMLVRMMERGEKK